MEHELENGALNESELDAYANKNTDNMDNIVKMMEMAHLMQSFMQQPPQQQENNIQTPAVPYENFEEAFDAQIQTPALQSIKAAIPHLEYHYRKNMSVMVKIIEIQKLLSVYSENALAIQSASDGDWRRNMLVSIRPFMNEQKQYTLDMLIKLIDISEIMLKIQKGRG